MDLTQYAELAAYWRRFPPTHLLIRAALGFKQPDRAVSDLGALMAEARPGGIFARAH